MNNLDRFIEAQDEVYLKALEEIKRGRKISHWMWYIFPQIKGLGSSNISVYYSIKSLEEAKEYLDNDILGNRLREISEELLKLKENNPKMIFGEIDSLKLKSSMTLFKYISNEEVFTNVLNKYYQGEEDNLTLSICENMNNNYKSY
jgi:uncharacterized protein (DUF1810 family)